MARTNTLNLNWRNKFKNEETKCDLCKQEEESLQHFLLYCPELSNIRMKHRKMQQPYNENIMKEILLFDEDNEEEINKNKNI